MARKSLASLEAQIAALEAALANEKQQRAQMAHAYDCTSAELASLKLEVAHDYVPMAEYHRVQKVLRTTQSFYAQAKRNAPRAASERRQAMNAAREAAMASGTTVAVRL